MFIHISDLQEGLFGLGGDSSSTLAQSIAQNDQPIILNVSMVADASTASGISFSTGAVSAFFSMLDSLQKPVWFRIALSPSQLRASVAQAVSRGKEQMQQIITASIGYGVSHLVAGFALNNIIYGAKYPDGSYWLRDHFNDLVNTAHNTYGKPVAVLSDPSIDNISSFTPMPPRADLPGTEKGITSNTVNPTALGADPGKRDWLIHVNPLYPWHIYDPQYPELIIDAGRLSAALSMMQTFTNISHGVVQSFVNDPMENSRPNAFDGAMGPLMDKNSLDHMRRLSEFLECLGVHDYCFTLDSAYGAITNTFIDPFAYKDKRTLIQGNRTRPDGVDGVTFTTKNGNFHIYNSGVLEFVFDDNLRPLTLAGELT